MKKIAVIGGGAAGMIAACAAARAGNQVTVYEKNEKLGKKLYITGKGRCNVTNGADMETCMNQVVSNPRFLYSAFYMLDNQALMQLIEEGGCSLKEERGQRIFPVSDKSSDVIAALTRLMQRAGVSVRLKTEIKKICSDGEKVTGIRTARGEMIPADAVILATGGLSYPSTGSTGDGYRMAGELGHVKTALRPALVPLVCSEEWAKELQGLALKNIEIQVKDGKKVLYREFGEMLFTHFGVSGPVVLSASSRIAAALEKKPLTMLIDLKPALTEEQLDARLLRDFGKEQNRQFKNSLSGLFPARLADTMVRLSGIDPQQQVNVISREQRRNLVQLTKNLPLTITGTRDYNEAIITQGGIRVKDVDPSTMESKLVPGLYFAGEVLDLDAMTGGFNLQIAWSTGWLAGSSV